MASLTREVESYRAALASLLEVDLELIPDYEGLGSSMRWNAWLASELNVLMLVCEFGTFGPAQGMWIAQIDSPYPGFKFHYVVCAGADIVWDPHPEPQDYTDAAKIVGQHFVMAMDPALPMGRAALEARG